MRSRDARQKDLPLANSTFTQTVGGNYEKHMNKPEEIVFKIKRSRVLHSIFMSFSLLILIVLILLSLYIVKGIILKLGTMIGLGTFGLIGCYPGLSTLQDHYQNSKRKSIKLSKLTNQLSFSIDGAVMEYKISDVKLIVYYYTEMLFDTPWSQHHYSEFEMNDGQKITISDLIISNKQLRSYFREEFIVYKNKIITSIE